MQAIVASRMLTIPAMSIDAVSSRATDIEDPKRLPRGARWFGASAASVSYTHLTLPTICSV